jgi:hypothetical protein
MKDSTEEQLPLIDGAESYVMAVTKGAHSPSTARPDGGIEYAVEEGSVEPQDRCRTDQTLGLNPASAGNGNGYNSF